MHCCSNINSRTLPIQARTILFRFSFLLIFCVISSSVLSPYLYWLCLSLAGFCWAFHRLAFRFCFDEYWSNNTNNISKPFKRKCIETEDEWFIPFGGLSPCVSLLSVMSVNKQRFKQRSKFTHWNSIFNVSNMDPMFKFVSASFAQPNPVSICSGSRDGQYECAPYIRNVSMCWSLACSPDETTFWILMYAFVLCWTVIWPNSPCTNLRIYYAQPITLHAIQSKSKSLSM